MKTLSHHEVKVLAHRKALDEDVVLWHEARDVCHLRSIHDLTIKTYFAR
jgi:hypothetical protein